MKRNILFLIFFTASLIVNGQSDLPYLGAGILKAGFAKIDITPDGPVKLYGYAARKNYSEGVHDPLSARAVVFENDGGKFILVSTDLGSFSRDVVPIFRKRIMEEFGLKDSELFLTTIHSHSSPVLSLDQETGDPKNIEYTKHLQDKLMQLITRAFENLKPVLTATASGSSPVGSNRREMRTDGTIVLGRDPYGITDKQVLVMKITDTSGNPVGLLYDYATHSTSLGPANLKVSGDVLGLSAQFTEKILGSEIVAPVFAGASGNIDPWYRVLPGFNEEPGWIPEPVLLGTLLGEEVVHLFRNIKETFPGGIVGSSSEILECRRKKPSDNSAATAALPETVPVNITVARIGDDVAFVGFNVEMLTEIGMEIKKASPFKNTFIITHCNGYSGYLPTEELYKEGGYEVTASPFEIGSSDLVVKKTLRMLYDLK